MSYEFIDVDDIVETFLPAEAMSYNGVYLENEIEGYRTLNVSGRELLSASIKSSSVDGISGSKYQYKTYPSRTIIVKFQLICDTDRKFREAFNRMNQILSAEQVKVIFNDEPDKYFIGTKEGNTDIEPGKNSVIGEFDIYCADPRKYSTTLKEFIGTEEDGIVTVNIQNDGTEDAIIDYEITNNSESGYLGIVSEKGAMEFGKIEEADGEDYQQNETLAWLDDFIKLSDDVGGYDAMHPIYGTNGSLGASTWFDHTFLRLINPGRPYNISGGGLRTLILPVDSNGDKGAVNFYSYFHLIFYAGAWGQTGEMSISFLTEDDKFICGVNWYKSGKNDNTGYYELMCYDPKATSKSNPAAKVLRTYTYTTSHLHTENPWYWDWGHCDIRKIGSELQFYYWGSYPKYNIPEIKDMKCAKVQIAIKEYDNHSQMSYYGFNNFYFQKMYVDKWKDVPNRYPEGSILTIDGETSHFFVNGMQKQSEEVLGTTYFKAPPGEMKIKFHVSTWTKTLPSVKVRIREVWL
ncbi:distal tail protein Dit [Faecalibacillus intestinalis]|uniref:distal tail protein Dit n=1 Tax=Faecalibacillus intestinalis TaxID=1982626 RepID=UPI002E7608CE|nr:distal tail protein Dit [Faecalibacillus intestinalis]MED9808871.1 phage tail family protein [Faecalibacillus intestinalis]